MSITLVVAEAEKKTTDSHHPAGVRAVKVVAELAELKILLLLPETVKPIQAAAVAAAVVTAIDVAVMVALAWSLLE
jgi:hypothetical protein